MNFLCSGCGACCRLAGPAGGANHGLPIKKDGSCGHLIDNKCSIYNTRPKICRVEENAKTQDKLTVKEYYIESTKSCHKIIDLFNLSDDYKIDITKYN
tara:strand:- start:1866 stop:2159 length:294 start_codon:yes stop_codon:yes gene_type:complete